jgi:phosphoribosyl 1,2-cyclic phosphodiesterase
MLNIKVIATGSRGNCYHITDGETALLIEAGIPIKKIKEGTGFKLGKVAGCLITHEHQDHGKAAKDVAKCGVDIYTSKGTADALGLEGHRIKTVQSKQKFNIGSWIILPFDTEHDAAEPLGFLLAAKTGERVLFATDTYFLRYKFKGLTHIMIECNYDAGTLEENVRAGAVHPVQAKRLLKSHFSIDNLLNFFAANDLSKVEEIYLIHTSGTNAGPDFKKRVQEATGKVVYI